MSHFVFFESHDPFEGRDADVYLGYALELARKQQPVTVLLVENGVAAARKGATVPWRDELLAAGATLRADEFALNERGIGTDRVAPGVTPCDAGAMVDLLADADTKAIWH